MEKRTDIHEENVPGSYQVNDQCIICDLCFEIAPNSFRASLDGDQSIVFRQPLTEAEVALAEEALESCPMESIERSADPES